MKSMVFAVCMMAALMGMAHGAAAAPIYADVTVSQGATTLGTFRVNLDYVNAPRTCANFVGLATGQKAWLDTTTGRVVTGKKYYDGLVFHRLIHNFMIQGGDPQGNGSGGPGYGFQDEFHPSLRHSGRYIISMANSGPNSNGSQFFILLEGATHLDDKHSVFGEVIDDATHPGGRAIIDGFTNATNFPTGANNLPDTAITINSVVISGPGLAGFDINDPAHLLPVVRGVDTAISYDPDAGRYTITWDRKAQAEYLPAYSSDLSSWLFTQYRFLLSMDAQTGQDYSLTGVTGDKFFSRMSEVDYSLVPDAPTDLVANGKKVVLVISGSETVTLTFDGTGGGTWLHSSGSSGDLTAVTWTDSAPVTKWSAGISPQAKLIPMGTLAVTFDSPMGSESWSSFNLPLSFHTATSGWSEGTAVVPQFPPIPGGSTTMTVTKRVPFTYTP